MNASGGRMQVTRRGHSGDPLRGHALRRAMPGAVALCVVTAAAATSSTVAGDQAASATRPPTREVVQPTVSVVLPTIPALAAPVTAEPVATRGGGDEEAKIAVDASVADIPARALAAYQRAAVVINAADSSCHLVWPVLAAIG